MSGPFLNDGLSVQKLVYDFAVDGGATSAVINLTSKSNYDPLPVGCVIVGFLAHVITAFSTGSSPTIAMGNLTDDDGYLVATAASSYSANACFLPGSGGAGALTWDDTNDVIKPVYVASAANDGSFALKIATAALTAGKMNVFLQYIRSV